MNSNARIHLSTLLVSQHLPRTRRTYSGQLDLGRASVTRTIPSVFSARTSATTPDSTRNYAESNPNPSTEPLRNSPNSNLAKTSSPS